MRLACSTNNSFSISGGGDNGTSVLFCQDDAGPLSDGIYVESSLQILTGA
ncbi:MAG: hypothetical protein WCD49_13520 [Candidatus Acidiferrales bacterium]